MGGRVYRKMEDGYYYDLEGMRYHHLGEEDQYTYEQVALVFKGDNDCVSCPTVDTMVSKAIDYIIANTPLRLPTSSELRLLYDCGTLPYKGHDKVPTQSFQGATPAP